MELKELKLEVDIQEYIISYKDTTKAGNIGGKARNLKVLGLGGFTVPEWICLSEEYFLDTVGKNLNGSDSITDIHSCIKSFEFPVEHLNIINTTVPEATFYAVRSSVADEDGSEFSFAGQFSSYLYVTKNELADKIKEVWLSAFSERVLEYRKKNGLSLNKGIAVIIQRMVNADTSGVGFGLNPVSGNRKQKLISAVYGLGEG